MPGQNDLLIRIGTRLDGLEKGLDKGLKSLKRFGFKAEAIGQQLSTRVSAPILAIGAASVATFAKFDKLEKGLSAITGSAAEGARQLDSYLDVVKDTRTTLDLETAVGAALKLQAVGFAAKDAENTIRQLGIAATVSGSSIDDVGGVVRQFSQILGKGKIEQEDLNTILDRMPALASVIRKEFGAATAEQIRDTGISMEDFVGRLTAAVEANKDFQNVQGGISKALESFGIELQIAGKEFGEVIARSLDLEGLLKKVSGAISSATKAFSELSPVTQKVIVVSAGLIALVGPLSFGLGAVAKSIPLLVSGFGLLSGPILGAGKALLSLGSSAAVGLSAFSKAGAVARAVIAVDALSASFAAIGGPVALIVAGVALLAASFYRAYQRSETFRTAIADVFDTLKSTLSFLGGAFLAPVKAVVALFKLMGVQLPELGGAFDLLLASVAALGIGLLKSIVAPFKLIGSQIKAVQLALTGDLRGALTASIEGFKEFGTGAATAFVGTFKETLSNEVKSNAALFKDPFSLKGKAPEAALPVGVINPSLLQQPETEVSIGTGELSKSAEFLKKVQDQYDVLIEKSKAYGASFDLITAKGDLFATSIEQALDEGFGSSSGVVDQLSEKLTALRDEMGNVSVAAIDTRLEENLGLNSFIALTSLAARATGEFKEKVNGLEVNPAAAQSFNDLGTAFEAINIKQAEFGEAFDGFAAKMTIVKDLITETVENGFNAYGLSIEELLIQQESLTTQQDGLTAALQRQVDVLNQIGQVAGSAFDAVSSAMSQGATAAQAFGRATVSAIREAIGAEIKLAVVTQARKALTKVPFPFNIAAATIAGAGASALFNGLLNTIGIPALAKGGFVDQPTLALIGEAGPEVVVPLDRLREFQNSGNGSGNINVTGRLVAAGSELIAALERARSDQYVTA